MKLLFIYLFILQLNDVQKTIKLKIIFFLEETKKKLILEDPTPLLTVEKKNLHKLNNRPVNPSKIKKKNDKFPKSFKKNRSLIETLFGSTLTFL